MVEILPFSKEHIPKVARLEKELFSDPWEEGALESHLLSPSARGFVLFADGDLASYILCTSLLDEGEVLRIGTEKSFLRQGFAQKLLEYYFEECEKEGVKKIFLEVRSKNTGARCLYEKTGFLLMGTRKGYYKNPQDDALLYQKNQNGKIAL